MLQHATPLAPAAANALAAAAQRAPRLHGHDRGFRDLLESDATPPPLPPHHHHQGKPEAAPGERGRALGHSPDKRHGHPLKHADRPQGEGRGHPELDGADGSDQPDQAAAAPENAEEPEGHSCASHGQSAPPGEDSLPAETAVATELPVEPALQSASPGMEIKAQAEALVAQSADQPAEAPSAGAPEQPATPPAAVDAQAAAARAPGPSALPADAAKAGGDAPIAAAEISVKTQSAARPEAHTLLTKTQAQAQDVEKIAAEAEPAGAPGAEPLKVSAGRDISEAAGPAARPEAPLPHRAFSEVLASVQGPAPPAAPPGLQSQSLSAPAHQQPAQAAQPAIPLHAVAIEIGVRAMRGAQRFDIRLDPAELGRVDVRLDVSKDGEITATLTADRVETLTLLQREAKTLERAFDQAGLKTSGDSLNFQLRQDTGGRRGGGEAGAQAAPDRRGFESGADDARAALPPEHFIRRRISGLDISI